MLSEALSLAIFRGDDPLPEASAACGAIGHRARGGAHLGVVVPVGRGHVALDDVLLSGDQGQGRDENRQERQSEVQGRIHSLSLLPLVVVNCAVGEPDVE